MMAAAEQRERTKVAVRRLPYSLPEETFKAALNSAVDSSQYTWVSFVPGKRNLKRTVNAAAFINFKTAQDVQEFSSKFSRCAFISEDGTQVRCQVQYAPCQKVPRSRVRRDAREGLLHKDREYLNFVERLNTPVPVLPSAEIQLQATEKVAASQAAVEARVVTPLMEFIMKKYAKKSAKRGQQPKQGPTKDKAQQQREDRNKPSRKGKDKVKKEPPAKVIAIPVEKPRKDRGHADEQSRGGMAGGDGGAAAKPEKQTPKEEASHDPGAAAPKLLLRKPKASETQVGSAEQGAAAAPATAQEKKGKPPKAERVRSGHQAYVPRSTRAESTGPEKDASAAGPTDGPGPKNNPVGAGRGRGARGGRQGKGGRGRSGKSKAADTPNIKPPNP
mmetsp:Transcript_38269/g.96939  ORF Transcript_38269/g.96939 Transcript_38269/m.96939 type:complete len:388 (-) Transcript_38269:430-1593(-)